MWRKILTRLLSWPFKVASFSLWAPASEGQMGICLAEVQYPILPNGHVIYRLRRTAHGMGRAAGPVAAQEKAGRGHQQGPRRLLPESVEHPSEGELCAEETDSACLQEAQ